MITFREMVANVHGKIPDHSVPEIVTLADFIQSYIYARDLDAMLFFDTTGMPPLMTTRNNILEYSFPSGAYSVGVRKTSAILFLPENLSTSGWGYGVQPEEYETYNLRGREYYMESFTQEPLTEYNAQNIIWLRNNPGTTTTKYYHLFYKVPPKISGIDSKLCIPFEHSLRFQQCILELLSAEDFGDRESLDYIERTLAQRIWADMDKAKQGRPMRTPLRVQDKWTGNIR